MSQNNRYPNTKNTNTQNRDKNAVFIGQYMKVKGCHKIEIIDKNDPDQGIQFRNMTDGCWPILGGLLRKDKGQVLVSGNTLVKVYR